MELNRKSLLIERKEAFRLWFEYLKLAHKSRKVDVKWAIENSSDFYSDWEMNSDIKFDEWWKSHAHLFEEKYTIRALKAGELPNDPDALIIEVPLTLAPIQFKMEPKSCRQICQNISTNITVLLAKPLKASFN